MLKSPIRVSPSVKTATFTLLVAMLALPVTAYAQKGKPAPTPPDATATVTIADGTGYGMVSDNSTPYPGATIFGASGDLRLDLTTGTRTIVVTLGQPVLLPPVGAPVVSPGTYHTDAVLFIQGIRTITKNTTARRVGRIGFGDAMPNHALGFRYTTGQGIVINGTEVCVSRLSDATPTWRITSSETCAAGDAARAGVFEENLPGKINHKWKGSFAVPFDITVRCTLNCSM